MHLNSWSSFQTEGPDGRYNLVADIDFRNLQLSSGVKWQLQATHTTLVNRYVDTLDFLISSVAPDLTSVRVRVANIM